MPLQKILLKPGVNKENTRYTNEGGWYDCDKIRFRQGTPEKIGGWSQISAYTYEGTCRSLWSWASLSGIVYVGVGTYLKFYIEEGGEYNDITPIRSYANALSGPFTATASSTTVTVADLAHGAADGDYVTFLGAISMSSQKFTVTTANPAVFTPETYVPADGTPILLETVSTITLSGVAITGIAGQFSCSAASTTLAIGQSLVIRGTFGGTGSITGYANPTTYYIIATNGSTTFTLSATSGGAAITTTAGTPTGLTYTVNLSSSTLPSGLAANVEYYVVGSTGSTFKLANVPNGAPIEVTAAGTGTYYASVNSGLTADVLNSSFAITVVDNDSYTITAPVAASAYDVLGTLHGGTVNAYYEIPVGADDAQPITGWGTGSWGSGSWGTGQSGTAEARLWYQNNFGQDLIYGYRGGPLYYWNAYIGTQPLVSTISISTSEVTINGGTLIDGTAVVLESTGVLPTGLTIGTTYYTGGASGGVGATFRLATSYANALAGTFITTTGFQSGTHYIMPNGIPVTSLGGASDVPAYVNYMMVSDASRFTIAFGCTPYGGGALDPMLIRWSDQESVVNWTPAVTNQAGYIRLSHGSQIITAVQARQEIVVFTDTSLYSLQYLGPPYIWGSQLLGDNISIAGYNTAIIASGVIYWMGVDKFYRYDGRVQTLRCDLRQFIYSDINLEQEAQFFAGTNEGFNEVWWFYCTANSTVVDRYVVYNYAEDIWYYGSMGRTAWLDSGLTNYPLAATYSNNLVFHEYGIDDNTTETTQAIEAYITSAQFDINDGHNFGFIWRVVPDLTFRGSSTTGETPQITMQLLPLQNSGSGYNNPVESANQSVGGVSYANIDRIGTYTVDQFTGQIYTRVRGRQIALKISSNRIGTAWQLGAPRIDIRPDGRR